MPQSSLGKNIDLKEKWKCLLWQIALSLHLRHFDPICKQLNILEWKLDLYINQFPIENFASNFVNLAIYKYERNSNIFLMELLLRCSIIILLEYLTWRFSTLKLYDLAVHQEPNSLRSFQVLARSSHRRYGAKKNCC